MLHNYLFSHLSYILSLVISMSNLIPVDSYSKQTAEHIKEMRCAGPKIVNNNPLDALDFSSSDFKGII